MSDRIPWGFEGLTFVRRIRYHDIRRYLPIRGESVAERSRQKCPTWRGTIRRLCIWTPVFPHFLIIALRCSTEPAYPQHIPPIRILLPDKPLQPPRPIPQHLLCTFNRVDVMYDRQLCIAEQPHCLRRGWTIRHGVREGFRGDGGRCFVRWEDVRVGLGRDEGAA